MSPSSVTPAQAAGSGVASTDPKDDVTTSLFDEDEATSLLPTLSQDGSRKWIRPRVSVGTFFRWRRAVAYILIAVFTLIPFIKIGGRPFMLLDLWSRRFFIFSYEFRPTDTLLLALFLIGLFLSIFFITALLGRVWCGWGCPQTVYMEFLYRPIERFFEGTPGRAKKNFFAKSGLGKPLKYVVFLLVSMYLAHTFLSYWVGVERLREWMGQSPLEHPGPFLVMLVTTALMMFDFSFFREQTCFVACPYGRMQSVLLDRNSLIVSYDPIRGEPRGRKKGSNDVSLNVLERRSDCVDCGLCVQTCPTGIDIRKGLQMECIGCAQCIDACDAVMEKLKRPKGLIRYSSQSAIAREKTRLLRPRVIIYPTIVTIIATLFIVVFSNKGPADVNVLRGMGVPHSHLPNGQFANQVRVKITNRTTGQNTFTVSVRDLEGVKLDTDMNPVTLSGDESKTITMALEFDHSVLHNGSRRLTLRIESADGWHEDLPYTIYGPVKVPTTESGATPPANTTPDASEHDDADDHEGDSKSEHSSTQEGTP